MQGKDMNAQAPVPMMVTYTPKEGKETELLELVRKHGPALRGVGLITGEPVKIWRATDIRSGQVAFVETFEWKNSGSAEVAHQTPEIMAVWEPMGPILADLKLTRIEAQ